MSVMLDQNLPYKCIAKLAFYLYTLWARRQWPLAERPRIGPGEDLSLRVRGKYGRNAGQKGGDDCC